MMINTREHVPASTYAPDALVRARGRDWIVMPADERWLWFNIVADQDSDCSRWSSTGHRRLRYDPMATSARETCRLLLAPPPRPHLVQPVHESQEHQGPAEDRRSVGYIVGNVRTPLTGVLTSL